MLPSSIAADVADHVGGRIMNRALTSLAIAFGTAACGIDQGTSMGVLHAVLEVSRTDTLALAVRWYWR